MKKRGGVTVANAVKAVLMAAPGVAAVHAEQASNVETLTEITVTATKYRPDNQTTATGLALPLIDTPQSISIISDQLLDLFKVQSAYDAVDMIPGASQQLNAYGQQHVLIRGQTLQPRVNTISSPSPQFVDSYALERVEVVRGPATVLYGVTGAFGGELNQILKKPTDTFLANIGVEAGDFARRRVQADFSSPVPGTDDRLKVRVLGAYTKYGIPQQVVAPPNNIDKLWMAAASYEFTPSTTLSLSAYESNKSFDPADGCPLAQTPDKVLYIPTSIPVDHWYCSDSRQPNVKVISQFQFGELSHKFANDWTMEFHLAHQKSTSALDYVFGFGPAGAYHLPPTDVYLYSYAWNLDNVVVTSNASLGGNFDLFGRTNQFFAALQYQKSTGDKYNYTTYGLGVMNMFEDGGQSVQADGSPIPPIPPNHLVGDQYTDDKELQASLQLLLNPLDRWQVLAGVLLQRIDLTSNNYRVSRPATFGGLKETDWVPRLGLTYSLLADKGATLTDAKAYFSYSEGVRPNLGIFDAAGNALTAPQQMKSYELGLKTNWWRSMDVSVDVFDSYVTNIPTKIYGNVSGSGGTFSNVLGGKNTYDGAELQVLGQVLPGWNVDFSYDYIKALVTSGLLTHKISVANVPRQQASLFTSYEFLNGPLAGLLGGVGVVWKDDVPLVDNVPFLVNGGYNTSNQVPWSATRVDFRLSYKVSYGPLKGLDLFGNIYNAFNSRSYYNGVGTAAFSNSVGRPRTATVGLSYSF